MDKEYQNPDRYNQRLLNNISSIVSGYNPNVMFARAFWKAL